MNGEYIKKLDPDQFYEMALPYLKEVITKDYDLKKVAQLVQSRIEVLPDCKELVDFFEELPEYDVAMYTHKKMKTNTENAYEILKEEYELLKNFDKFDVQSLHDLLMDYIAKKEIKNGTGLWPIRTAVSGKQSTPGGAFEIMEIIGKEESLKRIETGLAMLEKALNA